MRVHDGGDGVVVDVAVALFHEFDGCYAFFFGFMCEHGAEGAVTDDANVRELGAILFVDYEAAFVVNFEADVFQTKAGGVGTAPDGYEDDVRIELREGQRGALQRGSEQEWLTVSALPPFAASTSSVTFSPLESPFRTFVPSLNFMPCFSSIFLVVFEISASMPGPPIWPRNSTTVTSDPSLDQTEPCVLSISMLLQCSACNLDYHLKANNAPSDHHHFLRY